MQLPFFISLEESFLEFNFSILETNIINIGLLIGLLFYVKKVSLNPSLEKRQEEIIQTIENVQKDVVNASEAYSFCEKSFQKSLFWLQYWKNFYSIEKKKLILNKYANTKKILEENFSTTKTLIKNLEKKYFLSLQKYLTFVIASQILRKFFTLTEKEQSKLIEITFSNLTRGTKK